MKNKVLSLLLSVAIAFGMWMYVINFISPGSRETISDIPVVFEGETVLTDRGLMITGGENATIDLTLYGNRSDLSKVNKNNITIKVDLTKVYDPGQKSLSYDISFPGDVPDNAFTVENKYPEMISLEIEKRIFNHPVEVRVNFTGSAAENFIPDTEDYVLDYPVVNVTGPSSVVELIDHARIDVDLTDRNESISENYRYTLCDADGNPVDVALVTTDVAEVHLDVKIQRYKVIPLTVDVKYGGGAAEDNTKVTPNPASIYVSGSEALLADLEEILLGAIDLSTIEEDTTMTFPITLPEGVTSITEIAEATVQIQFSGLAIKEFEVTQIEAVNVPEGMEYELMNPVLKVRLRGKSSLINSLKPEDIVATIDFAGRELGAFTIKPALRFSSDAYASIGAVGAYSVSVTLVEETPDETEAG